MEQPESQLEIANQLLAAIRSLIVDFPEHMEGHVALIKKTLASPNQTQIAISVVVGLALLSQVFLKFKTQKKSRFLESPGFPLPESLDKFDWTTTEPLQFRPFKPKYHLTMALENLNPSELIPMDKTYKERIQYRCKMFNKHPEIVVAIHDESNPRITAAIYEFYRYIMSTYLPVRYPTMFRLHETTFESGRTYMLENLVTNELYPSEATALPSPMRALEILYKTVDEDFLILLPDKPESETDPSEEVKYRLIAYESGYPAGFNPRTKIGKLLADIHAPVPGYQAKLEKSMDRHFAKLEVGKYVKRVNWSISTHTELFAAFGGLHDTDSKEEETIKNEELNVDSTLLRCERQTLHRLPTSRALVFGFHTYTYPIKKIKEEGLGEDLAVAIDGLKGGSAPGIYAYKRGPVWGDAVKAYLRS